jgi:hypothetical protein
MIGSKTFQRFVPIAVQRMDTNSYKCQIIKQVSQGIIVKVVKTISHTMAKVIKPKPNKV